MIFILLLASAAALLAGTAAYFSVYGLAHTFAGVFWSVVIMGGALEYGSLVALSFLYRYWLQMGRVGGMLKTYLIIGIISHMALTSAGIFAFLSSGYQTDVLPLKQIEQQVKLLEGEKDRSLARKTEIDKQISQLPTNFVRGRERLIQQFKEEQQQVTNRVTTLENDILAVKTKQIQTEAHIGPIIYIAKAFDLDADNATKYLIYLIIFSFDPMAVALTFAMNIVIRLREKEQEKVKTPQVRDTTREREDLNYFLNKPMTSNLPKEVYDPKDLPGTDYIFPNPGGTATVKERPKQILKSPGISVVMTDNATAETITPTVEADATVEPLMAGLPEPTNVPPMPETQPAKIDPKDQTIAELEATLKELQSKKDRSPQDDIDLETIRKFFRRNQLVEDIRIGNL